MEKRPELIGGFLLHVNGREYDYSIQGRLKRLEQKIDLEVKKLEYNRLNRKLSLL